MSAFEIKKVNQVFDKQIFIEQKSAGAKENCLSYYNKIAFNLSLDLSLDNWRKIRTPEFWKQHNILKTEIEKKAFLCTSIQNYLS